MAAITAGAALWISQVVLLFHYLVYVPIMLADPRCTTRAVWGALGPAGRAAASASAAAAYAVHLALLWTMRGSREPGIWLSSLLFYVLQTAFLPFLHQGNCAGKYFYKALTRLLLGVCAVAILWYAWTVWSVSDSVLARAGAAFVAFHVVVMDFVYFGFWAV